MEPIKDPKNEQNKFLTFLKSIPKKYLIIGASAVVAIALIVTLILVLIPKDHEHVAGNEVKENVVAATCTTSGGYDKVVYCTDCGEELSRTAVTEAALGHNYTDTVVAPTCIVPGYTLHACTNSGCTEQYTDNQVAATGHSWTGEDSCDSALVCAKCNAQQPATAHTYVVVDTVAATCTTEAKTVYACSACGDRYEEITGTALGHDTANSTPVDVKVNGCTYVQKYDCARCGEKVDGDTIERHNLTSSITTAPTCTTDGVKTTRCTNGCGYSTTSPIEKNETGHKWSEGTVNDGKRIDTCAYCNRAKVVTVYTGNSTGSTNAENFKDTEIEINDTNISMDDGVVDAMGGKDVVLSADKLEGDDRLDLGLDSDKLAQVGDNPIYNFTISAGNQTISSFGDNNYVTITVPYTLEDGEDVDNIAIWFISDDGELESIPAVYNNGYVTFKTNHFSYYTVTKLTPAERCELYGHSNTTRVVEGTCTTDGYTLNVCVRCHKTEKTDVVVADGHDLVATTTPATCVVSGKTVYACADCGYSYENKIFAAGHTWEPVSFEDATCTAPGSKTYSCSECNEFYTETIPQKTHELTSTVVAADCTTDGYTLHKCANCDYYYQDNVVAATGHSFTAVFNWGADNSTATVVLTCANNAQHNTEVAATVTVNTIDATCSGGKVHEYTATLTYDGKTYTDMKSVTEGNASHNFGSEWKSNDTSHWHECTCGAKDALANHAYNTATVTKEPTCVATGTKTYACVCGKTRTETIAATGVHNYVNGVCTGCGAVSGSCDHVELHREYVDMMKLGFCGGTINYLTCDCGEVVIFDENYSELDCDIEYQDQVIEETDNGQHVTAVMTCEDCGLYAKLEGWMTEDTCVTNTKVTYSFYAADRVTLVTPVLIVEEKDVSHRYQQETITAGCGGKLIVQRCPDCNEIVALQDVDINCAGAPEFEVDIDYRSDEDQRYAYEFSCSDCGLYISVIVELNFDGCDATMKADAIVKIGNEIIWDYHESERDTDHNYGEEKYELIGGSGSSCADGVKITEVCSDCGDTVTYVSTYHGKYENGVELDLSQYSDCIKRVSVDRCTVCGDITYVHDFHYNCEPAGNVAPKEIVDSNGKVIGYELEFTCADCGLTYTQKMLDYKEGCKKYEFEETIVRSGSTVIFEYVDDEVWTKHNYEYNYEMFGTKCEDGVRVTSTCKDCGYSHSYNTQYHQNEDTFVDLREYGLCGGQARVQKCSVCGEITSSYVEDYGCEWQYVSEQNGFITHKCYNCNTEKQVKTVTSEKDSECRYSQTSEYKYFRNSNLVYSCEIESYSFDHDYEYRYELDGKSCTDGVRIYTKCRDCGNQYDYHITHHTSIPTETYEVGALGACHGTIELHGCPCGERMWLEHDICAKEYTYNSYKDGQGNTHNVEVRTCSKCGLRYQRDSYYVNDIANCKRTYYYSISASIGSTAICSFEYQTHEEYHEYNTTATLIYGEGSSCEDGVILNRTCKTCGYTYSEEYTWHVTFTKTSIDMSEYGSVCGGYFVEEACACGYEYHWSFSESFCNFDHQRTECWADDAILGDHGNEYFNYHFYDYVCSVTSPACGFTIRYGRYYVREGCMAVEYEVYRLGYDKATNTYKYELKIKTGNEKPYHSYVDTDISGTEGGLNYEGTSSVCSLCGAFSTSKRYYDVNRTLVKYVEEYSDASATDSYCYRISIEEYTEHIPTRYYDERRYADGTKEIEEICYEIYNNRQYEVYSCYEHRDGFWEKITRTYSFEPYCHMSYIYTDSRGNSDKGTESAHHMNWYYIEDPTCTQPGIEGQQCVVCGYISESYEVDPIGHNWEYWGEKNTHVCIICGLENANGASGEVVMEDLSDSERYIIGYWARKNIQFTYYVEILVGDELIMLDGINIYEHETLRALVVDRSVVRRAAAKLGYAEGTYLVRFTCVPYGADGSHDYAITFDDNAAKNYYIGAAEYVEIELGAGSWELYSFADMDSYVDIYDQDGYCITSDDDSGVSTNFYITVKVPEGMTYTARVRWLGSETSGSMKVVINQH